VDYSIGQLTLLLSLRLAFHKLAHPDSFGSALHICPDLVLTPYQGQNNELWGLLLFLTFCLDTGQTSIACLSRFVRGNKLYLSIFLFLLFLDKGKQAVLV
jgi:hypothetical protein